MHNCMEEGIDAFAAQSCILAPAMQSSSDACHLCKPLAPHVSAGPAVRGHDGVVGKAGVAGKAGVEIRCSGPAAA